MKTGSQLSTGMPPSDRPLWRRILGWPSTRLGWWAVGLVVGFLVFFGLFQMLVASGQRGGETFFSNPWLALSMLVAAGSAIAAGITAAIAIFGQRERSFVDFVALVLGLFVLVFMLGEILFPH